MKVLILDTETNGLVENRTLKLEKQPSVIEFYGCLVNLKTKKVLKDFDTLIKPPNKISGEITKITGITNDDLVAAPPFIDVSAKIFQLIEKAPIIIAHNASFDREMLDIEAQRLSYIIKWPRVLCTVEQTVSLKGFRLNLNGLHEFLFNEPFTGAHRAKVDVQALTRICCELFKRGIL